MLRRAVGLCPRTITPISRYQTRSFSSRPEEEEEKFVAVRPHPPVPLDLEKEEKNARIMHYPGWDDEDHTGEWQNLGGLPKPDRPQYIHPSDDDLYPPGTEEPVPPENRIFSKYDKSPYTYPKGEPNSWDEPRFVKDFNQPISHGETAAHLLRIRTDDEFVGSLERMLDLKVKKGEKVDLQNLANIDLDTVDLDMVTRLELDYAHHYYTKNYSNEEFANWSRDQDNKRYWESKKKYYLPVTVFILYLIYRMEKQMLLDNVNCEEPGWYKGFHNMLFFWNSTSKSIFWNENCDKLYSKETRADRPRATSFVDPISAFYSYRCWKRDQPKRNYLAIQKMEAVVARNKERWAPVMDPIVPHSMGSFEHLTRTLVGQIPGHEADLTGYAPGYLYGNFGGPMDDTGYQMQPPEYPAE